uniref:Uncharacterized protein n=1 Tax=Arundo donax TaxID=35708 RepID=A0A0A9A4X1_ARUDO
MPPLACPATVAAAAPDNEARLMTPPAHAPMRKPGGATINSCSHAQICLCHRRWRLPSGGAPVLPPEEEGRQTSALSNARRSQRPRSSRAVAAGTPCRVARSCCRRRRRAATGAPTTTSRRHSPAAQIPLFRPESTEESPAAAFHAVPRTSGGKLGRRWLGFGSARTAPWSDTSGFGWQKPRAFFFCVPGIFGAIVARLTAMLLPADGELLVCIGVEWCLVAKFFLTVVLVYSIVEF